MSFDNGDVVSMSRMLTLDVRFYFVAIDGILPSPTATALATGSVCAVTTCTDYTLPKWTQAYSRRYSFYYVEEYKLAPVVTLAS